MVTTSCYFPETKIKSSDGMYLHLLYALTTAFVFTSNKGEERKKKISLLFSLREKRRKTTTTKITKQYRYELNLLT